MSAFPPADLQRLAGRAAVAHLALLVIGVTWAFGGNADFVRTPISLWASLGIALCAAAYLVPALRAGALPGTRAWAWPVAALNLLVLAACLTPGFRVLPYPDGDYLLPVAVPWWRPSTAGAGTSLRALWLFDGLYCSCLNLALLVQHKSLLRGLLAVVAANAVLLAVFGTVQKLARAPGLYFGAVASPQEAFFASFVYDNHWSAFILLMLGICIGLVFRYAHGSRGDGFFRGPAPAGVIAVVLLFITIPFSGSRLCSLLALLLLALALAHGGAGWLRAGRAEPGRRRRAGLLVLPAAALTGLGLWFVAGDVIAARAAKTREQVSTMVAEHGLGARQVLYRNTWHMAQARPVFGWGMGSFPRVFALYNTQEAKGDHIPVVYHDAHSDWLQAVAELGFLGAALLAAAVVLPGRAVWRRHLTPVPLFLGTGCALVALYAGIEFPFGNVAVVLCWWLCYLAAVQYLRLPSSRRSAPPFA